MSNDLITHENDHVIGFLEPDIEFVDNKAVLTFRISDAAGDGAVVKVAEFIDAVCDANTKTEVDLRITADLAKIPDFFLEINCEGASADEDGLYHMNEKDKPQVDMIRAGLMAALTKIDNVRFHNYKE